MRKLIIIIITLLLSANVFAQFAKPHAKSKFRKAPARTMHYSLWSVGLSLKSSAEFINPKTILTENSETYHKPKFSYEVELFIERKLENASNFILVTGFNFHSVSFEYDYQTPITFTEGGAINSEGQILNQFDLTINNPFERISLNATTAFTKYNDGNDYAEGDTLNFRMQSVNRATYFGIPIAMKKEFGYKVLKFTLKAGVEPAMLLKSEVDYNYYHNFGFSVRGDRDNYEYRGKEYERVELLEVEPTERVKNTENFQANAFLNVGFVHYYKYHTFFIEAEVKRGLLAFSSGSDYNPNLQSIGVKVGFIKRFTESGVIDMARPRKFFRW